MTPTAAIAIVDDDPFVLSGTYSILRSAGCIARTFSSAEELLASDEHFACVITDMQMPGMSGLELLRALKARSPAPHVIIMTGFPDEALRERAMEQGAAHFFSKDCDADELIACVTGMLRLQN